MMGQHSRSEALFYYFRVEDQVPENHLLRLIDKHVSFSFVRAQLKDRYSETGRPSIDPELLLRILLIGYLYGIRSERKLMIGLRRLRLRRLKFVREQFFLAAAAQNLKRLVRFLSQSPRVMLPATN